MRIYLNMLEIAYVFGNVLRMCEIPKIIGKWLKYVGNGLVKWETTLICGNGLNLWGRI